MKKKATIYLLVRNIHVALHMETGNRLGRKVVHSVKDAVAR